MSDDVFDTIRACVVEVLPDVPADQVTPETSLRDLGANSLDRADIAVSAMHRLGVSISSAELSGLPNVGALAELLRKRAGQNADAGNGG